MVDLGPASLANRRLSYHPVGATRPDAVDWPGTPTELRRRETTTLIRGADHAWTDLTEMLLRWAVKTRSGFAVDGSDNTNRIGRVVVGERHWVSARFGPVIIAEPVEVVAVVDTPDRSGFAYGTLEGHPVSGEEAFIVHLDATGQARLTLRSLTQAAPYGPWRLSFPALLVAQRVYRRRYQRALDPRSSSAST